MAVLASDNFCSNPDSIISCLWFVQLCFFFLIHLSLSFLTGKMETITRLAC